MTTSKKMEDDLKKNKKTKTGRRPKKRKKKKTGRRPKRMREKNGRHPEKKWKTNQSTKINLIGCDTIVNSPSIVLV